jgi:hypothetical protein
MNEGGDRGKAPNETGTQPVGRVREQPDVPGDTAAKGGPGRGPAKSVHAAEKAAGVRTSETRKAGPKSIPPKTTSRSSEKRGR